MRDLAGITRNGSEDTLHRLKREVVAWLCAQWRNISQVQISAVVVTIVLGEYLCMRLEQQEIVLPKKKRRRPHARKQQC